MCVSHPVCVCVCACGGRPGRAMSMFPGPVQSRLSPPLVADYHPRGMTSTCNFFYQADLTLCGTRPVVVSPLLQAGAGGGGGGALMALGLAAGTGGEVEVALAERPFTLLPGSRGLLPPVTSAWPAPSVWVLCTSLSLLRMFSLFIAFFFCGDGNPSPYHFLRRCLLG